MTCQSRLLTEAERWKPPVAREPDAVDRGINLADPYLLQSTAEANYVMTDTASIQFPINNKSFFKTFSKN